MNRVLRQQLLQRAYGLSLTRIARNQAGAASCLPHLSHCVLPRSRGTAATFHNSDGPASAVAERVSPNGAAMALLAGEGDVYDGVAIDAKQLPDDPADFAESLRFSLQEWRQSDRKGIWLRLPIEKAQLVPVATQQGFYFHHAEREYVMLAQWLPQTEDKLPANASHQVGVGAFVFDRLRQKVLMVQEKNGPLRGKGVWKMPTGLSMAREYIADAAVREVEEETGVRARFRSVLAFRQAHTALFGKSDLFVVVALEPETADITIQEDELVDAQWQSLEEFEANPFPATYPLLAKIVERCLAYARGEYAGLTTAEFEARGRIDSLTFGTASGGGSAASSSL